MTTTPSRSKEPTFTVVDKRGQNREQDAMIETPKPVETEEVIKSKRIWKNVAFMVVLAQSPNGMMILGRAVGLRQDGVSRTADYVLPPIYSEHLDWVKEARRRLNTFLGCDCKSSYTCHTHQIAIPNWVREDSQRLEAITRKPLPEAVEAFVKAEQSKPKIVLPR